MKCQVKFARFLWLVLRQNLYPFVVPKTSPDFYSHFPSNFIWYLVSHLIIFREIILPTCTVMKGQILTIKYTISCKNPKEVLALTCQIKCDYKKLVSSKEVNKDQLDLY